MTQNWNLLIFIRKTNAHVLPVRTESLSWMLSSRVVPSSQQVIRWWHPRRAWGGGTWTVSKVKIAFWDSRMRVVCLILSRVDLVLPSVMLLDELELNTNSQCCWAPGQDRALNITSGKKTYLPTCWQFISRWGLTPAPRAVTSIFPLWNCRQLVCGGSARPINIYTFYSQSSQSI